MSAPWIVAFAALWLLVLLLGLLTLGTLRRLDQLLVQVNAALATAMERVRRDGLQPGSRVGPFTARSIEGGSVSERDLIGSKSIVLFLNSACASCGALAADLRAGVAPDLGVRLFVVTDDADEAQAFAASRSATVLVQEAGLVARAFDSHRTPHAFYLDEFAQAISAGTPNGWAQLRALISTTTNGGDATPTTELERVVRN